MGMDKKVDPLVVTQAMELVHQVDEQKEKNKRLRKQLKETRRRLVLMQEFRINPLRAIRYRDELDACAQGGRWIQEIAREYTGRTPSVDIQTERMETSGAMETLFVRNEIVAQYCVVRDDSNFSILTMSRFKFEGKV